MRTHNPLQNGQQGRIFAGLGLFMAAVGAVMVLLAISAASPESTHADNPGAIWTTDNLCGAQHSPQDVNAYQVGDHVFINGDGFPASTAFTWTITGQPGGASADPGIVVASGSGVTDSNGAFCFDAYTVQADDDGTYTADVNVSGNNKNDNYRVSGATATPTATATNTATATATATATNTATATATATATNTATATATSTGTVPPTSTPTNTAVATSTNTAVPTSTGTTAPTSTATTAPTNTAVPTGTSVPPTSTVAATVVVFIEIPTVAPTATATPTATLVAQVLPTAVVATPVAEVQRLVTAGSGGTSRAVNSGLLGLGIVIILTGGGLLILSRGQAARAR